LSSHITPILQSILDAVVARGAECGLPSWCRTGLSHGSTAWDVCCECSDGSGQLWVRLVDMQPDPEFAPPNPGGCDQPVLLTVGVGSLRCVPTLDESGHPPSAEEDQASAELIVWDAEVVKDAVMCGLDERYWRTWRAMDNLGGCGGGEHTFQIPFHGCRCDDCD
jgi:hypothetical protein